MERIDNIQMGDSNMKLHLGCGKRDFGSDWIHIDGGHFPHVTSHNIQQLPFDTNSCDIVYASHVIEYFDSEEVVAILNEWRRVLKPRPHGIIRLAVPDFEAIAKLYVNKLWKLPSFLGPLYGKVSPPRCETFYHKTVYDFESLKTLLQNNGFCRIQRYDWRQTEHADIDDHSQAYLPHMDKTCGKLISLNVEGVKNDLV